ncbi:MAG: hypothetical protein D6797_05895 [Bdellovibrio sp.]|nr:MAG: hypothetical protein D6797_05895 [Bdellovibrio sp.]
MVLLSDAQYVSPKKQKKRGAILFIKSLSVFGGDVFRKQYDAKRCLFSKIRGADGLCQRPHFCLRIKICFFFFLLRKK